MPILTAISILSLLADALPALSIVVNKTERSLANALGGKSKMLEQQLRWRRLTEAIDADHAAVGADIAVPEIADSGLDREA
jgi:hypothetical protein